YFVLLSYFTISIYFYFFYFYFFFFFFFSSRRRHTRSDRDWSSDVCSSDLTPDELKRRIGLGDVIALRLEPAVPAWLAGAPGVLRSEERRVGKECRSRWSPDH